MSKVLVTGANGFVAATIIDQLIAKGYVVTGSIRTPAKGSQILALHPEYAGKLDFVVVSDYAKPGTWDDTFREKDFEFVVHTAAPLLDDPGNRDFERDFLGPSVGGATELLKSAKKYGKSVKAVVVTGSINAMTTGQDLERVFSSSEWLPLTIDDAIKAQHPYISYCVAKAESEKAIWKFVDEEKPDFSVTVLLPALIFGPPLQPVTSLKRINYSNDVFYGLFNGSNEVVPGTSFPSYIDVRDLAIAHIKSLTTPAVANQRLIVGGKKYSSQIAVDALKTVNELEGRLPRDGDEVEKEVNFGDVEEWNGKLGLVPRSEVETFGDAARRILELEELLKEA
ncbi:hypothetical protein HYFRA_00013342 [Hymenoscyphus fraxineus]|uniref:NAD-dependent epimerase/dehydratase domain-containing protein n=1 Tax=Hymenoscyphus fraxineus TaxID=746836 RepID=A0A9N9L8G2_9HELO|nr:hypothetical protein HYFRA_00013342 [Hymenoscyphus fraxineus]